MAFFLKKHLSAFFLVILTLLLFDFHAEAQVVVIPRDGFPYCEPFTNSTTRANTIFGGNPIPAMLTAPVDGEGNGFLQLTNNDLDQRGYVFVDLPFSAVYGLKVTFEYFAYGGQTITGADGISFFMFDGAITPADFQIGGQGGALSYSPWENSSQTASQPGLKGAYLGIGFDAFRNFGNEYEGKYGGFKGSTLDGDGAVPDSRHYYNSIAVRGPESSNYQFITGKRVFNMVPNNETPSILADPIPNESYLFYGRDVLEYIQKRFTIGSASRALTCLQDGYRKVFIDLKPDGGGTYLLNVTLLYNNGNGLFLEPILENVPYNFVAPSNLKLGFAASTGTPNTNYHEIRNVTAEVSDVTLIPIPEIDDLRAEVCVGDDNLFEFDVDLQSDNSFVRCVQLYGTDPGPPNNVPSSAGDPNFADYGSSCGFSNVCVEKCNPANNTITLPGKGTFIVELEELNTGNIDTERYKAKIRFVAEPGFEGEAEIYYQVIDNYGLTSFAKTVTVISNPIPEFRTGQAITFPSCDGLNDGMITDVVFGDLVAGFDYEWIYENSAGAIINLGKANGDATVTALTNGEATFTLAGINVGSYTLNVWNPSDSGGCPEGHTIVVDQELGTPIDLDNDDQVICANQEVNFIPSVGGLYDPNGTPPVYLWYLTADRSGGALTDGQVVNLNGNPVTFDIGSQGELTISGLTSDGANPRTYEFFVEVEDQTVPNGPNFCPFIGIVLASAKVTVIPELQTTLTLTDDFCVDGNGRIEVSAVGGSGSVVFTLLDDNGATLATNGSGDFPGLLPGEYTVEVESTNPTCIKTVPATVDGPDEPLFIDIVDLMEASCGLNNGEFNFQIGGGNGTLGISNLSISGGPFNAPQFLAGAYNFSGLAPGIPYTLILTDTEGCTISEIVVIDEVQIPVFSVSPPLDFCENAISLIFDVDFDFFEIQATAVPIFNWFIDPTGGTAIANGTGPFGFNYNINNSDGTLTLTNLSSGDYTLYLEMGGTNSCNLPRERVDFTVQPLPEPTAPVVTDVSCFEGTDGTLQVALATGNLSEFEYRLVGDNGIVRDFEDNDGFFENLPSGSYNVTVRHKLTSCLADAPVATILQPTELNLGNVVQVDPYCLEDNGEISFDISGGTPKANGEYNILLNNLPLADFITTVTVLTNGTNEIQISDLAPGNYEITVSDDHGCPATQTITLTQEVLPEFDILDQEICLNEEVELLPITVNPGSPPVTPLFRWFKDAAGLEEIQSGLDPILEMQFEVNNATGRLYITNIAIEGDYTFYILPEIDSECPPAMMEVLLTVNPIPDVTFETEAVTCFGGSDGIIRLVGGGSPDYEYSIIGSTSAFEPTSGQFEGLAAGDYTIQVLNKVTGCLVEVEQTISQPEELIILAENYEDPSCGAINGEVVFTISGGVQDYLVTINGATLDTYTSQVTGNLYTVRDLAPGTYSVEVVDGNTCAQTAANLFTLVNNDGLDIQSEPILEEICEGAQAQLEPVLVVPAGSTPELRWYSDLAATQQILSDTTPQLDGGIYQIVNGILTIDNLEPGSYQYYLRITGSGICEQITPATVEVIAPITADIDTTQETCFGNADGIITINGLSGGSGIYEFSIDGTNWQADPEIKDLAQGSYTVYIRDDTSFNGCQLIIPDVLIEGPDAPITAVAEEIFRASCGLPNGRIFNLVVSGGYGGYTFEWRKDNPATGDIMSQGTLTGLEDLFPGTYYLILSDLEGCLETFEYIVGSLSDPVYEMILPMDVCEGLPVEVTPIHLAPDPNLPPAAPTDVFWYHNSGQNGLIQEGNDPNNPNVNYTIDDSNWINPKLTVTGLSPGTYTYYFYVVCTDTEMPVEVTIYPTPAPVFEVDRESCNGANDGKIRVSSGASPDLLYSVNGGGFQNQAALEATSFTPGTYTIRTQSTFGCEPDEVTVEILGTDPLVLELIDQKDAACGIPDGFITVRINGGWPDYNLILTNLDNNQSQTVTVSTLEYTFSNLTSSNYQVSVEDEEGCVFVLASPIAIEDGPTEILIDNLVEICEGEDVLLTPTINPAAAVKQFRWYRNSIALANEISNGQSVNGVTFQLLADGSMRISGMDGGNSPYTFLVTVEGPQICVGDVQTVEVVVYPDPEFIAIGENEICFGEGGKIQLNPVLGASNITFSLNGGPFQAYSNNLIENLQVGTYTLEAMHASGCTYLLPNSIVIEGPSAILDWGDLNVVDASCAADNGMISGIVTGGWEPYTVTLENKTGIVLPSNISWNGNNFEILGLSVGEYIVRLRDDLGCEISSTVVAITDAPTPVLVDDIEICEGEVGVLTPSIPNSSLNPTFKWFRDPNGQQPIVVGQSNINGITYTLDNAGELDIQGLPSKNTPYLYYVDVEGTGICSGGLVEVQVKVSSLPQLRTSNPSIICNPNETVDLTRFIEGFNSDIYDYMVTNPSGQNLRLDEIKTVSVTGTYNVTMGFKGSGCFTPNARILVIIAEEELIAAFDYQLDIGGGNIIVNEDINIGEEVQFKDTSLGNAVIWNWDFGDGNSSNLQNPIYEYTEKGTYTIKLTTIDALGCQSEFLRVVQIFDDYLVIIPNAFTPDRQDGMNNYFKPKFRGIGSMEFLIFNTWGELIYQSEFLEDLGWDGRLNGVAVPNGNYVYKANFVSRGGEKFSRSGVFTLIR